MIDKEIRSGEDPIVQKQVEKALRESEALYQSLIRVSPLSICRKDLVGCFTFANQRFLEGLNRSLTDLIGLTDFDLHPRELAEKYRRDDREVMDSGQSREFIEERVVLGGESRVIQSYKTPIYDGAGKINGVQISFWDITERKQAEETLQNERLLLRTLIDNIPDSIYSLGLACRKTLVNSAEVRYIGAKSETDVLGKDDFGLYPRELAEKFFADDQLVMQTGKPVLNREEYVFDEKQQKRWLLTSKLPLRNHEGRIVGLVGIGRDITDRKQAEEETQRERAFFDRLVETAPEGIAITDTQGRVMRVNTEFMRMFGYGVDEAVGQCIDDLVAPPARQEEAKAMTISVGQGETNFLETVRRRKDGSFIDVSIIAAPVLIAGKQVANYAIYRDITERKQLEQKLEEVATHDSLTGLPNRRLLLDRFTVAAALAHRNKSRLVVMSLDVDKFKSINDTLGHDAGDQVLKVIGTRLTGTVRAIDTLARVGGDEFISVMMVTGHMEGTNAIAQKILDSFAEPLSIAGHELHLSTSIGIAIYPEDAEDLETLTKKSDAAMYYSKDHGRNQFKFYGDGDVRIG